MKKLFLCIMFVSLSATAEEIPEYMKDGTITVTLKDGKQYTYSTNEYKVVKRGTTKMSPSILADKKIPKSSREKDNKNIISLGAVRSKYGVDVDNTPSVTVVEDRYKFGAGLMYQRNFHKELWLGGRVDTNGGTEVNLGLGF